MQNILEQPTSTKGSDLKKKLETTSIAFTTIYVESDVEPKLLMDDEIFPYKGFKKIETFIESKKVT